MLGAAGVYGVLPYSDRGVVSSAQEKLAYHRRSRKQLSPGLYLGYLKLCTSMDQIRALVPQKLPNVLCHSKIRDNANVSRWPQLHQTLSLFRYIDQTAAIYYPLPGEAHAGSGGQSRMLPRSCSVSRGPMSEAYPPKFKIQNGLSIREHLWKLSQT